MILITLSVIAAACAIGLTGAGIASWALAETPSPQLGYFNWIAFLLRLSVGLAVGLALWSASYSAVLFCFGSTAAFRIAKDVILALIGLSILVSPSKGTRATESRARPAPTRAGYRISSAVLGTIFLLSTFGAAFSFLAATNAAPEGGWDAWAIWNLRARFLARSGDEFAAAFSPAISWTHPDYPLLLPGLVAQVWIIVCHEPTTVPAVVSFTFLLISLGTMVSGISSLKDTCTGSLAGLVLISAPIFVQQAASQYADVPLAAYQLIACMTLVLACESSIYRPRRLIMLTGFMAAAAAWTKNEGILFFVSLAVAIGILPFFHASRDATRMGLLKCYLLGALPLLVLIAYFKWKYAPANDLASDAPRRLIAQCTDLERHLAILRSAKLHMLDSRKWNYFVLVLPFFTVACGCRKHLPRSFVPLSVAAGLVSLGFYGAYLVTPHDINWHLDHSIDRLFVQMWPIVVLTLFLPQCRFAYSSECEITLSGSQSDIKTGH